MERSPSADSGNSTAFQRWLKKAAILTGVGITPEERQRGFEDEQHVRCEKWKAEMMNYSLSFSLFPRVSCTQKLFFSCLRIGVSTHLAGPSVVFMLKHLRLSGCNVPPENVICTPCDLTRSGGFHPAGAIVLCQNHPVSKRQMEDTLTHELVHMYDHCKFNVDWHNLRHHACSEVRSTRNGCCCSTDTGLRASQDSRQQSERGL